MARQRLGIRRMIWATLMCAGLGLVFVHCAGSAVAMSTPPPPAKKKTSKPCGSGKYWSKRCGTCARICPRGQSYSCSKKKCYRRRSEILSDQEIYLEAVSLIEADLYREALDLLWTVRIRDVPKVLNYIGYTTRKLGDVDEGIKYYKKALALDPNFNPAREYLGEGYLQKGDLPNARLQLAEIGRRCGTTCLEYRKLADEISGFLARNRPIAH